MKSKMNPTQKLVFSALMMALYIAVLFISQGISYGAYQMRLATALYGLSYLYPFLVLPLSLANAIGNSFGGLGLIDVLGGFCAGLLTTGVISLIRRANLKAWWISLPIFLIPSFVAPLWLSSLLGVPYWVLVGNLLLGQLVPALLSALLIRELAKRGYQEK